MIPAADPGDLSLISPSPHFEHAFTEMAAEFAADGEPRYLGGAADFGEFLRRTSDSAAGRNLPPGFVAESHFWLVQGDVIVGNSRLRHVLNPKLDHEGGHVGYDIRPSCRRRGFGTVLLRLTLERAAALGIVRARLTCDSHNVGSIRIIESNGGVLDGEGISHYSGKPIRQFWVPVPGGSNAPRP